MNYYVFDNKLFFEAEYPSAWSGLWNKKAFFFEYDLNAKKLNYVGCVPIHSDILKIDPLI